MRKMKKKNCRESGENVYWYRHLSHWKKSMNTFPVDLPENPEQYNTLAGFYFYMSFSDIPEENQEFDLNSYHFKILKCRIAVELVEMIYMEPVIEEKLTDEMGEA